MPDDRQLMCNYAHRGDVTSLSVLVATHSKWLLALLRGLLSNEDDALDATQETWMRVIRFAGGYRGGSVRAYIARTARSVVIDRFRREGRTVESLDAAQPDETPLVDSLADDAPGPDDVFETAATAAEVRAKIAELPYMQREVLLLRIEGELEFREIAAQLGAPLGSVLTWMRRATARLRKELGEMK